MSEEPIMVPTTERHFEHFTKFSHDLKVGDELYVFGLHVSIDSIEKNHYDEMVLELNITGALTKKRSKMRLIIPKKTPVEILIEKTENVTS